MNEEAEKWRTLAVEAAHRACEYCEEYMEGRKRCGKCRIKKILEEAAKE